MPQVFFHSPISKPRWIGLGLFVILAAVAVLRVPSGLGILAGSGCLLIGLSFLFANLLGIGKTPFDKWDRAFFLSAGSCASGFILVLLAARAD